MHKFANTSFWWWKRRGARGRGGCVIVPSRAHAAALTHSRQDRFVSTSNLSAPRPLVTSWAHNNSTLTARHKPKSWLVKRRHWIIFRGRKSGQVVHAYNPVWIHQSSFWILFCVHFVLELKFAIWRSWYGRLKIQRRGWLSKSVVFVTSSLLLAYWLE